MRRSRLHVHFVLLLTLVLARAATADVQFETSELWRRARLLAPGQQVLSVQSSYDNTDQRFDGNGRVEPLGQAYGRAINWGSLLKAESAAGQSDLRQYMQQHHLQANDLAAVSDYRVRREELRFDINWAYGLTRTWMIGLVLPITHRNVRVQQSVSMTPSLMNGVGQRGRASLLGGTDQSIRERVRSLAQNELTSSGYDQVPEQRQSWDWGDISILSQESLLRSYHWMWSFQQLVRFPTSQNPSLSDYIQTSDDEGQVDIGATSLVDLQLKRWVFGWRLGYVSQLPDSLRMRVPEGNGSAIEPSVRRDLGDWAWTSVDTEWRVVDRLDVTAEHYLLSKARDRYHGSGLPAENYNELGLGSDEQLQQTRVGLLYRLGASSVRNGVVHRWAAAVNYTYPWIGRNASDASQASVELMSYF